MLAFSVVGVVLSTLLLLSGCGRAPRSFQPSSVYQPPESGPACQDFGCPLGYVAPPAVLTVHDELQREFDRCLAIGTSPDCVQEAFAVVRQSKGLDKSKPTGTVTVRKLPEDTVED